MPKTTTSPEKLPEEIVTRCQHCGEASWFIGYDPDGFPGDISDHEPECPEALDDPPEGSYCTCTTMLVQHYRRDPETGEIDYSAFAGGGSGAEIGEYHWIVCGTCRHVVWTAEGAAETVAMYLDPGQRMTARPAV